MFKKILVAYDGSPFALKAVKAAASLAEKYDSAVTLLTVVELPNYSSIVSVEGGVVVPQQVVEAVEQESLQQLEKATKEFGDRAVQKLVTYGHPAAEIIEESKKGYQLVLVGSRGLGELEGLLMGSVSHRVAHYAGCPVMIIH